jgi:hypothetical protein
VLDAAREALAAADRVAVAAPLTRGGTAVRFGTAAGLTARLERGIDGGYRGGRGSNCSPYRLSSGRRMNMWLGPLPRRVLN